MKIIKITMAIALATATGSVSLAQKLTPAKVPAAVKSSFAKAYPNVKTVKWEKEKGDFEADFKQSGDEMSAVFMADGMQKESEMGIKASALPALVTAYVKQNYKGAAIKEAAKITRASGEINYEAEVKGKDLLFDSTGKFIKIAQN
ncbi:PepSY-like domain-containing protein [Mucilaginibacter glaciei]|uniref:PepSY-like domain-containing protein n=1 Tax=Mucilaginibacter glaciei TaxID=2772109 RepID=A0A926NNQ0_9SPHI|nr:PepSY-like domain-containing protein [Mucilaginibacter glaciei]MBD1392583.1 PepSY-like domain-containing protein [Mucilaginibacter glaciei]